MNYPTDVLVPFQAPYFSGGRVLWASSALDMSARNGALNRADRFFIALPVENERPRLAIGQDLTTLWAERYGGAGLGANGGGVRCGNVEDVQIKGVGSNLLAGADTDYWHRHGAMSVQDALREALWGELFEHALPYGAVRSLGVLSTGTQYQVEVGAEKGIGWAQRALLVREQVLRPAHFMRSSFWVPIAQAAGLPSDTQRTRAACACAHGHLVTALSRRQWAVRPANELAPTLAECWNEVWRRCAIQLATARAKRFIHGSLTPSNYGVDGRWLDFGTCTALATHGRAIVAPGSKDFWSQEAVILEAIEDQAFYLRKYLPPQDVASVQPERWTEVFTATLRARQHLEFAKLSGIPTDLMAKVPSPLVDRFSRVAARVAVEGASRPYLYYGGAEQPMPLRTGRHDLAGAMRHLAWWSAGTPAPSLANWVADGDLAFELATAYGALRSAVLALPQFSGESFFVAVALAAATYREHLDLDGLWRFVLDVAIDAAVRNAANLQVFLDQYLATWAPRIQAQEMGDVCTKGWLTDTPLHLSFALGWRDSNGQQPTKAALAGALQNSEPLAEHRQAIAVFLKTLSAPGASA